MLYAGKIEVSKIVFLSLRVGRVHANVPFNKLDADGGCPWKWPVATNSGQDLLRGCLVIFNGSKTFFDVF